MKLLLDTCALLWLAQGGGRLSESALSAIDRAAMVYVSAISGFEVGLKYRQGKLKLPSPPGFWFDAVTKHHQLSVIAIDLGVSVLASELPPFHRDPADRFIIATGMTHRLPVVTADPAFHDYDIDVLA